MDTQEYYVYALVNSETNRIFYIGKGKNDRCYSHLKLNKKQSHNLRLYNYIKKLKEQNIPIRIDKLHENLEETVAYQLEEEYIKSYGRKGYDENGILLNICDSARPPNVKGIKRSEEHRKKISESNKRRIISEKTRRKFSENLKGKLVGENNPFWGKKHTEETKEKISEANKGRIRPEEERKRISESHKGKIKSEKHKENIGKAHSCWWEIIVDEETYVTNNLRKFCEENDLGLTYNKIDNIIYENQKCPPNIKISKISERNGQPYDIIEPRGRY